MIFERRAAMATLLANRPKNLFVVPGLGSCTWDAFAAGDEHRAVLAGARLENRRGTRLAERLRDALRRRGRAAASGPATALADARGVGG